VAKGLVPSAVKEILLKKLRAESCPQGETVLLAGELSELGELGDKSAADPAVKLLEKCGERVEVFYTPTGTLAYALGDIETAREQATGVARALEQAGVRRVVADGPQTMYAIKVLYPLLGVSLPGKLVLVSLAGLVEPALGKAKIASKLNSDQKVFFHDSRSACFLAEGLASDEVIQPAFCDREEHSGSGEVYEQPRRILEKLGLRRVSSVWSRSLSKSTGTDDGLWLTYPVLAAGLARMRLEHIQSLGADVVVTDSVLDAVHLRQTQTGSAEDLQVYWLPELFRN